MTAETDKNEAPKAAEAPKAETATSKPRAKAAPKATNAKAVDDHSTESPRDIPTDATAGFAAVYSHETTLQKGETNIHQFENGYGALVVNTPKPEKPVQKNEAGENEVIFEVPYSTGIEVHPGRFSQGSFSLDHRFEPTTGLDKDGVAAELTRLKNLPLAR